MCFPFLLNFSSAGTKVKAADVISTDVCVSVYQDLFKYHFCLVQRKQDTWGSVPIFNDNSSVNVSLHDIVENINLYNRQKSPLWWLWPWIWYFLIRIIIKRNLNVVYLENHYSFCPGTCIFVWKQFWWHAKFPWP